MKNNGNYKFILALAPTSRGFGFAVFEDPKHLIDWGVSEPRSNWEIQCRRKAKALIDFYQPEIVVVEDTSASGSRRGDRARVLMGELADTARDAHVGRVKIPRQQVLAAFERFQAHTKYEMAKKMVEWLPELKPRLPRLRLPWMSEDYRMGIFDAVALGLTFYYLDDW